MLAPKVTKIYEQLEKEHEKKFGKEPEPPQVFFSGEELTEMAKKGDWPEAWGGPDELKTQRVEEALEKEKENRKEAE